MTATLDDTIAAPLPRLRDDLKFLTAADDGDGSRGNLIFDPVRHLYFRIGERATQILSAWCEGSCNEVISHLLQKGIVVTEQEVESVSLFLESNNLTIMAKGGADMINAKRRAADKSILVKLVHSYLFFRLPLIRPERFLVATLPLVRPLSSRWFVGLVASMTIIGIYMTVRQSDVFVRTFVDFANWRGVLLFGVAMVILKTAHEFSHAFVATAKGCRVPTIGIAFMVMFPMLYSDVTDAWRLPKRRDRLSIDAAGIAAEMCLGGGALFMWSLLPDGPVRSMCFFIATTGWIMSLMVNLSPFMRFDGYHILADILGIHNLQQRGFAMGRWKMREILFGFGDHVPEQFSARLQTILVAYAWGTWIYRFFLFLGISLLVYFYFFKLLGIIAMAVELIFFLGAPILREISVWWQRRVEIFTNPRGWLSIGSLGFVLAMLVLPLGRSVNLPGILGAGVDLRVYSPVAAQVTKVLVKTGDEIKNGQILVRLHSPVVEQKLKIAERRLKLVEYRLARAAANREELAMHPVLLREKEVLRNMIEGLQKQLQNIVLRAKSSGVVTYVARGLKAGMWVSPTEMLVHVASGDNGSRVRAMAAEPQINRLQQGATGVFIPEDAELAKIPVRLATIGISGGAGREMAYLSSVNGGSIAMSAGKRGKERSVVAQFPVEFVSTSKVEANWLHEIRGTVVVDAKSQSVAGRFFRHAWAVILRESGF